MTLRHVALHNVAVHYIMLDYALSHHITSLNVTSHHRHILQISCYLYSNVNLHLHMDLNIHRNHDLSNSDISGDNKPVSPNTAVLLNGPSNLHICGVKNGGPPKTGSSTNTETISKDWSKWRTNSHTLSRGLSVVVSFYGISLCHGFVLAGRFTGNL